MKPRPFRFFRSGPGFSLLELLVATSISSVVAIGMVTSFMIAQRSTIQAFWENETFGDARIALDTLVRDVRGAIETESTFTGTIDGSSETFSSADDTLILKLPAYDSDQYLIDVETSFDRIIYTMSEDDQPVLVRYVVPDALSSRTPSTTVIGDLVNGLGFSGTFATKPDALGAFVVHYQLKASHTIGILGELEMPLSGSVRLRNRPVEVSS